MEYHAWISRRISPTDDDRKRLARIVDAQGTTWPALLDQFVTQIEQTKTNGESHPSAPLPPGFDEDTEYLALCMADLREIEAEIGSEALTLEAAECILSNVSGSMLEDVNEDRGDR